MQRCARFSNQNGRKTFVVPPLGGQSEDNGFPAKRMRDLTSVSLGICGGKGNPSKNTPFAANAVKRVGKVTV